MQALICQSKIHAMLTLQPPREENVSPRAGGSIVTQDRSVIWRVQFEKCKCDFVQVCFCVCSCEVKSV